MTAFSPAQSPPLVSNPIRFIPLLSRPCNFKNASDY
jgi:hypothetical protein